MNTVTIVCPHCYNEGDHPFYLRPTPFKLSGSNRVLCENCFKKFRVYFQEGRISNVARV
jgi:hypothetical protein